ncbi:MAG: TMEM175 family protein [Candidatus Nitrosocosmicus sp.]
MKLEYLIAFSDALFAFAITLMVALTIEIPNFPSNITESEITEKLGELLSSDITHYIISFLVVGAYWVAYHRVIEYIKRINITFLWLNLIFLLFISLVAFFTGLLANYNTYRIVVIYFASILSAAGFMLCIIWWYATHNRKLVDKDLDANLIRYLIYRGLASPIIFLISIGISFIDVQDANYFWIVIIPVYAIIDKIHKPYIRQED